MKRLLPVVLLTIALPGVGWAAEIRTVSDRLDEDVTAIAVEGGRTVVKTSRRTIPLELVKQIRFDERAPQAATDVNLLLTNRDEIHGSIGPGATLKNPANFELKTAVLGAIEVDFDKVAALFMNVAPEEERRLSSKFLGWLQAKDFAGRPNNDTVHLRAGGRANGVVSKISAAGIVLDMSADKLGNQTFALRDVLAVVLGNAGGAAPRPPARGTMVRIRCSDGSSLSGTVEGLAEGRLELRTELGTLGASVKNVLDLFVLNGAFVYLSDLDPTQVDEKFPDLFERTDTAYWGWKRDKEVCDGGRLRLGGRTYDKGLGVHTYSSLTFALNGGFREFRAVIGLDDVTKFQGQPGMGSATFRVLLDGKPAKELAEGRRKKKGEPPDEITVNVEGVKEITLVADYGNYVHVLGRADWADAYLVKK